MLTIRSFILFDLAHVGFHRPEHHGDDLVELRLSRDYDESVLQDALRRLVSGHDTVNRQEFIVQRQT